MEQVKRDRPTKRSSITLPDEMLVILLLSSLPKCFENFVVAIEARDSLPLLSSLKVKLLEKGARQRTQPAAVVQQKLSCKQRQIKQTKNTTKGIKIHVLNMEKQK